MKSETVQERRQCHRLRYPKPERPSIDILGQTFQVCEISELGMRLLFTSTERISLGEKVSGIVHFFDDEDFEVEGVPLRQHGGEVAVKLSKGLPPERLTEEQLQLSKRCQEFTSEPPLPPSKLN